MNPPPPPTYTVDAAWITAGALIFAFAGWTLYAFRKGQR